MNPKGFHRRGYLPHLDVPGRKQAITFRLADSLPKKVIEKWHEQLRHLDDSVKSKELRRRTLTFEDAGHGSCLLAQPHLAEIVQDALLYFHTQRYHLHAWCIMPNHIHALLTASKGEPLGQIIKSWKIFTTKQINKTLNRSGSLWASDYFDRYIRDEDHLAKAVAYIEQNPVKAGLSKTPEAWPWSSASH